MFPQLLESVRREFPQAKIVLHLHWGWVTLLDRRTLERPLAAADLIVSCSDALTEVVREAYPRHADRGHTLYNGVDSARSTHPLKQPPTWTATCGCSSSAGSPPDKGVHVLLDAFQRLLDRHPRARLDIAAPVRRFPGSWRWPSRTTLC